MKLRSFLCFLLIACSFTALLLNGCSQKCEHEWEYFGPESIPYCPKCGTWVDAHEHTFEGASCFQYGTCIYCEHVQSWNDHQWTKDSDSGLETCSVCDVVISVREVSDADRAKIPSLRSEVKSILDACSMTYYEREIDTIMAGMLSAYNYYLGHGDITRLAKTIELELERFDAIAETVSSAAASLPNKLYTISLEQSTIVHNMKITGYLFEYSDYASSTYENNDELEQFMFKFEYTIVDIINDTAQNVYDRDLI